METFDQVVETVGSGVRRLSVYSFGQAYSLSLFLIFVYIIYNTFFRQATHSKRLPPGPKGFIVSKTLLIGLWKENLYLAAEKWATEHGDVVLCRTIIGNFCFLNSARTTREVFKGKESEAITNERPKTFVGWYVLYNHKSLLTDGPNSPTWILQRKLFHTALKFYGDGIAHFESTVQLELVRLKERLGSLNKNLPSRRTSQDLSIQELVDGSKEVEIRTVISGSLACVLNVLMTGECPAPDDPIVGNIQNFTLKMDKILNPSVDLMLTVLPFLRFVPGSPYKRACDEVVKSKETLLNEMFKVQKISRTPGSPRGIIDYLEDERAKEGNTWITEEHVCGIILVMMSAAMNTSLNTILSIFLLLVHHPHVIKKIQNEIDDKIGQRQPQLNDRKSLQYTEAVILETLRYTSIVPLGLVHENCEEFTVDGFCIPKKSLIFSNTWSFHHDPLIWGNDADEFRPERFLDDKGNLLPSTHPLLQSLLPFGVGKRVCPGENFARSRLFLYVASLLQSIDILPPINHALPSLTRQCWQNGLAFQVVKYHLIMKPRSGLI